MRNVTYTPGPWEAVIGHSDWGLPRSNVIVPVGGDRLDPDDIIAEVYSQTPYCAGASKKDIQQSARANANARIIALAPAMHVALLHFINNSSVKAIAPYECERAEAVLATLGGQK